MRFVLPFLFLIVCWASPLVDLAFRKPVYQLYIDLVLLALGAFFSIYYLVEGVLYTHESLDDKMTRFKNELLEKLK
jgi:hypothetical protein